MLFRHHSPGKFACLCQIQIQWRFYIHEDFLFCKPLQTNTTGEAVFEVIHEFMLSNEIEWAECVGLSTDGARAMVGRLTGVVKQVKDVAPLLIAFHCSIHREALATKTMPTNLKTVLDEAVKTVNFIKSRPLQSHLFGILCAEMGRQLLLHTKVRAVTRQSAHSALRTADEFQSVAPGESSDCFKYRIRSMPQ